MRKQDRVEQERKLTQAKHQKENEQDNDDCPDDPFVIGFIIVLLATGLMVGLYEVLKMALAIGHGIK